VGLPLVGSGNGDMGFIILSKKSCDNMFQEREIHLKEKERYWKRTP